MSNIEVFHCPSCGVSKKEKAKYCSECGALLEKAQLMTNVTNDEFVEVGDSVEIKNEGLSKQVNPMGWITAVILILILGIFTYYYSNEESTSSQKSIPSPVSTNEVPESDETEGDTRYVSEWKIFSEAEAVNFWSAQLGERFSQDDIFVKLLFPSISSEVKIYSLPYIQLLIWPTSEYREQEVELLDNDIYNSGDLKGWASCSNVVIVFPDEVFDSFVKWNDTFCEQ